MFFWLCQNSRATATHMGSIKFPRSGPGKHRAPTVLLQLCLSLKQSKQKYSSDGELSKEKSWVLPSRMPPQHRGAGMYKGVQWDQKTRIPLCRHVHTENMLPPPDHYFHKENKSHLSNKKDYYSLLRDRTGKLLHWRLLPSTFVNLSARSKGSLTWW